MTLKTCAVCGKPVHKNTGTHFGGKLVHLTCVPMAETMWFRMGTGRNKK